MKTSVTKIMMSFALMGCLIIGASDASAQGRSRSQGGSSSSRSQSAAVSRSNSSATPSVSRSSSTSSRSAAPKVERSSSPTSHSVSTPQVNRSNSGTSRNNSGTSMNRGATTRGGSDKSSTTTTVPTRRSDSGISGVGNVGKATKSDRSSSVGSSITDTRTKGSRPDGPTTRPNGGKGGNDKPNGGKGRPNGGNGGMDKPNGGNGGMDKPNGHNGGSGKPNGNRPDGRGGKRPGDNGKHGDHDKHGGNRSFNPNHRYDYNNHHYRDQFSWNYTHHNWSRPLPPPVRPHRLAPWVWRRPYVPAGWRPYPQAPVIDRILNIVFGTYFVESLNHLYCNGYYIDGYNDDVIFLRDVPLLGLYWPDAMLNYSNNRFANAQFVYYSDRYDDSRYNLVINKLTRTYGVPVCRDGVTVSWYGSDGVGFATLSMINDATGYYTTLSIGY